jgi:hypothetical protein
MWNCGLVCCFLRLLGVLDALAVGSSLLNRQDAKNAKIGFTELRRRCGYKAYVQLSEFAETFSAFGDGIYVFEIH